MHRMKQSQNDELIIFLQLRFWKLWELNRLVSKRLKVMDVEVNQEKIISLRE